MAEINKATENEWEDRACKTFSAERKEDFVVLVLSGLTVLLVSVGIIGAKFFNSLFF
jgi:hypothetical protein